MAVPSVSVLICTSGRANSVVGTVESVLSARGDFKELILIDQSPDRATEDALCAFAADPRFRYLRHELQNKALALNHGLMQARGEIVVITDDDCEVDGNWLEGHLQAFLNHPRVALTFGSVLPTEHDRAKGYVPDYVLSGNNHSRKLWGRWNAGGIGANMAVRRDIIQQLGGFDPMLSPGGKFYSCEDRDLTLRCLLAGHEVFECQDSIVTHAGFRNWQQGRTHTRQDWIGIGAVYAKPIRCGYLEAFPASCFVFLIHALIPFLQALLLGRSPKGWLRIVGFLSGFWTGWRTPVDCKSMLYWPDVDSLEGNLNTPAQVKK